MAALRAHRLRLHALLHFALICRGGCFRLRPAHDTGSLSASLRALSPEERLAALRPVSWVHVPKTGSVIMNAVLHLPGVCPKLTQSPADQLCSPSNPTCQCLAWMSRHGRARSPLPDRAPGDCPGIQRFCLHSGFNTSYLTGQKGHGLIMLRQPEQRLMSAYYNKPHHHSWSRRWTPPKDAVEYAEVFQGFSVKMLTRDGDAAHGWAGPPARAETELAVSRLRDGFAFVGIVEEYELSVCLLHVMFGNECHQREFVEFHTGPQRHNNGRYKLDELRGFQDKADRALFAEGVRIFKENLGLYNVSKESCMPCFSRGKVSQSRLEKIGNFVNKWDE